MILNVLKNGFENNLCLPAKEGDVGFDLIAQSIKIKGEETEINPQLKGYKSIAYIEYDTKICVEPESYLKNPIDLSSIQNFFTLAIPRSSITKYNLVLKNSLGLIDPGYRNSILFRFQYIFQPEDLFTVHYCDKGTTSPIKSYTVGTINYSKIYQVGDRIGQLIFAKSLIPELKYKDKLSETDRGMGGFGSTNK